MDSGCISIWRDKPLDISEKKLIRVYAHYIDSSTGYFIKFRDLKIEKIFVQKQIFKAIGYIPNFEILLFGFGDLIFNSAEAILKEYGGFLKICSDVTKEELNTIFGQCHFIFDKYIGFYLMDWKFVSGYFNCKNDNEINKRFSIPEFKKNIINYFQYRFYLIIEFYFM